jgi:antitoxin MazE
MIKHLTKHGNSYALIIDRPILDLLKIDPETPLDVTTDGSRLTIQPRNAEQSRERIAESLRKINKRYGRALKKLAE